MSDEIGERAHRLGAERHGDKWLHANRRAVEWMWGTELRPDSRAVKEALPLIILKVLDGHMVDLGYSWCKEDKTWVKRIPAPQLGVFTAINGPDAPVPEASE